MFEESNLLVISLLDFCAVMYATYPFI
jgi:hypothetical protein